MPLFYKNVFQTRLFREMSIFAKARILCFAFNVEFRESLWLLIYIKIPTDLFARQNNDGLCEIAHVNYITENLILILQL